MLDKLEIQRGIIMCFIPFKRNFLTSTDRDLTYTQTESAKTSFPLFIMGKNKIPFILQIMYVTMLVENNINIKTFAQILPQPNQHLKHWEQHHGEVAKKSVISL